MAARFKRVPLHGQRVIPMWPNQLLTVGFHPSPIPLPIRQEVANITGTSPRRLAVYHNGESGSQRVTNQKAKG
jgi:hypothetical protein